MNAQMYAPLFDRTELKPFRFSGLADACRRMGALLDLMQGIDPPRIGLFLGSECLEPALALLVRVINNPRLALDTLRGFPFSFADRHCSFILFVWTNCSLSGHLPSCKNFRLFFRMLFKFFADF